MNGKRMMRVIVGISAAMLALLGVVVVVDPGPDNSRRADTFPPIGDGKGLAGYVEQGRRIREAGLAKAFPVERGVLARPVDSDRLLSGDPRRIALSPAELGWMQKHHYPTEDDLAALASLAPARPSDSMDPRATTRQGLAMLQRGNTDEGIALLRRAAATGAIYAYEEAAIAEHDASLSRAGRTDDADDKLRAHLEVARIMGDYKVDYLVARHLPAYPERDPARALAMQQYTSEFMRQLGLQARSLGVPAPGPDPRPGAEQWRDLQRLGSAGQAAVVDVYVDR